MVPPESDDNAPRWHDRDVAKFLNCSRNTVWRLVRVGLIPGPFKIGHMARWRPGDIKGAVQ